MAIITKPPNVPISTPEGNPTPDWWQWFYSIFQRVGGSLVGLAPDNATYITQTPNSTLSGEQALSLLSTGYAKVNTGSGVISTTTTIPYTDITGLGTLATQNGTFTGNGTIATGGNTLTISGTASIIGTNTGDQTNISGNAATVTTNANLTGPITSVGNATSIASQTGTGSKFVVDTSPTLVTPTIGAANATSINFGDTSLSNYKESTWTPTVTLVGGAGNTVPVYSTNTGNYTRIGNIVFCTILLSGDGGAEGAGTGTLNISLPITTSSRNVGGVGQDGYYLNNLTREITGVSISGSSTTCTLFPWNSITAGYGAALTGADQNNTTRAIYLQFFYYV